MRVYKRDSLFTRLLGRVDTLPQFVRPIVYGALAVLFVMFLRGALLIVPIVLIYVLATSHTPLADLTLGVSVVGLAVVGGAFAGLSYSVLGRHLVRMGRFGRSLAGISTIAPYMFVLPFIMRIADHKTVYVRLEQEDWVIVSLMSALFGIVIGEFWFGDPRPRDSV